MRALELLKQIISTLSMNGDINLSTIISTILKRQILNTLLQTIEDYEFSNVAS
jgi:hypothetical protein